MTEHYYAKHPTVQSERHQIKEVFHQRNFTFHTDAGVFSKKSIDFGSKLLIHTMNIPSNATIADIGCGYGPIGITAAALAKDGFVSMVDINERALELARDNAYLNEVNNVEIMASNGFEALRGRSFSVILMNPPIRAGKQTVYRLFEESYQHLIPGGELWVVIQKKQGAPSARKKLADVFNDVTEAAKEKGYSILYCKKKI